MHQTNPPNHCFAQASVCRVDLNNEMKKMNEMISTSESSDKNFFLLLVLCFLLGVFGVHRFYCGKIKPGIL